MATGTVLIPRSKCLTNAYWRSQYYTMCYHARFGAYTELYAGLSPDLTTEHNGRYIAPWGRLGYNRADIEASLTSKAEGGSGKAEQFWQYCERETKQYM